jgi:UDP-glucose 4-epimerase
VARDLTVEASKSILGAAAESRVLEALVVRSGIEVYGRGPSAPTRPDESAAVAPTCEFGRSLAQTEAAAGDIGRRIGVPVAAVRLGSVLGPHVPSPLGRLLRMPAVPFSLLADPPFAVAEDIECAKAFVAAAERRLAEPVNVLAGGAITALQAILRGRRVPIPLVGPEWRLAKLLSGLGGAPIPDHVLETLHRGRLADNGRMQELVGFSPGVTTVQVIDKLYAWPSVIRRPAQRQVA